MQIPLFKVYMSRKVNEPLLKQIHSGWIGQGDKVKEFEDKLAKKFYNENVLTTSAGTHALTLALRLCDVGPHDVVISTPLTCTATNMPILQQGANIAWADVKDDFNIDPESIERVIESYGRKPKAIMVVHWGGYPCDMEEIRNISNYYDIPVIEDAAHAYGSTYMGSYIGECHWSDFTMFSFQAIKHLTSVDGGCLFCLDEKDYERGKLLRWYGIDRESPRTDFRCEEDIAEWGYKFHMNDICALIGMYNMEDIDANIEKARHNARIYDEEFSKIDGITLTQTSTDRLSSYWLYTMMVENRSEFCYMMGSKGIAVSRVHERNDKHTFSKRYRTELPNLEKVIQKQICVPVGWWVGNEERQYIIDAINGGW